MKKYEKVYLELKQKILELPGNTLLGNEERFAEELGVSRKTVRRALRELKLDGDIYSVKGIGTFVAKIKEEKHLKIAVLLPEEQSNNYKIMDGILFECNRLGVYAETYITKMNLHMERVALQQILEKNYDGIIAHFCADKYNIDLISELCLRKIPVVCVDEKYDYPTLSNVRSDNAGGMRDLVSHFLGLGYGKIAFIDFSVDIINPQERFFGYCMAHLDWNKKVKSEYIYKYNTEENLTVSDDSYNKKFDDEVRNCVAYYASMNDRPEVYCAVNDVLAVTFKRLALEMYPEIFKDAVFVGFDYISAFDGEISSCEQNFLVMGRKATKHLIDRINLRCKEAEIVLPTKRKLIVK